MKIEAYLQGRMRRFLDGAPTFRLAPLVMGGRYRSSTLALFSWVFGLSRLVFSLGVFYLAPVVFLGGFYATVSMDSPMRILLLFFPAVVLAELFGGWLFRPKLEIRRELPERVRAGSTFRVRFSVCNRRRIRAFDLFFDPFNYGPELRVVEPAVLGELAGGQRTSAEGVVLARRRGRCPLYRARVESHFPFHLFKWSCRGRREEGVLTVYPAFTPLRRFAMPVGKRHRAAGAVSYAKIGESMDLMGVRDYREGDDIRRIDWAGSARTGGDFVVKEFEEDELKKVALVVDTWCPNPPFLSLQRTTSIFPELEAALELAASLTDYFARGEAVVELFAAGPEVYHIETGRGSTSFDAVCDILAGIRRSPDPALDRLAPEVFRDLADVGGAVVLLLGDDPSRRKFVERLRENGVSTRVILLTEKEHGSLPPDWLAVSPRAVSAGEVFEL